MVLVLCACLITVLGCSSRSNAPPPNPVSQPPPAETTAPSYGPTAGSSSSSTPSLPGNRFLDFPDIPIPPELTVQPKSSNVFQSGPIKMGFLTLRGRVDSNSVMSFFVAALPHEGWRLKGQFRYNRALLIFDKPDRVCVILVKEDMYYNYVEIYVSPVAGT
jgi:hypothetical protein